MIWQGLSRLARCQNDSREQCHVKQVQHKRFLQLQDGSSDSFTSFTRKPVSRTQPLPACLKGAECPPSCGEVTGLSSCSPNASPSPSNTQTHLALLQPHGASQETLTAVAYMCKVDLDWPVASHIQCRPSRNPNSDSVMAQVLMPGQIPLTCASAAPKGKHRKSRAHTYTGALPQHLRSPEDSTSCRSSVTRQGQPLGVPGSGVTSQECHYGWNFTPWACRCLAQLRTPVQSHSPSLILGPPCCHIAVSAREPEPHNHLRGSKLQASIGCQGLGPEPMGSMQAGGTGLRWGS